MSQEKMTNNIGQFSALKIFKHLNRIAAYRDGGVTFPVSVDLSLSNLCNQNCIWCYYRNYLESARVKLDKARVIKLIDELSKLGIKGINFSGGGEPLTHPGLIDLMEYAHGKGIDVGLITNGVLLDELKCKRLSGISKFVRISLSSSTSMSYAKYHQTPESSFQRLKKNLGFLGRFALDTQALTGVLFLLEERTERELLDTVAMVKDAGIKFIEIRSIKNTGVFTPGALKPNFKDLTCQAAKLQGPDFKVIIRDELFRTGKDFGKSYKTCYIHEFVTSISAEGDVYLCCEFEGRKKFSFGNINKQGFEEIWLSDDRKRVVKNMDLNKCFACCKGDGVNQLFNAIDNTEHYNFI